MSKIYKNNFPRKGTILMSLLPLAACGGSSGGGSSPTPAPTPAEPAEFIESPTAVFIARDDRDTTLDQGGATTDLTVTGKGGNDVIATGSGADTIVGGGGNDKIRAGEGADNVSGGAGNDAIVVVGTTTANQYTNTSITNSGGSGTNLSDLITLADLNGRTVSEVLPGEVIDGGPGTNTLFIYGTVDLTGVTLNNITVLVVNSDVTLTPEQIAQFTTIDGDGNSVINIEIPAGSSDNYILDLSALNMTDIGTINIDGDITIKVNNVSDLAGVTTISTGVGDELTLEISGAGTTNLADIANKFDQINEIELGSNTVLNVDNAADITSLGLTEVSGNGEIETSGTSTVEDALDALTIAPTVNTAPVAHNDSANANENQTITIDVVANDTDVDNDSLSLTSVSVATGKGTVSIVSGNLRFNPGADFDNLANDETEQVIVSYTISDGNASDDATLAITITGTNDAPVAQPDTSASTENQIISIDVVNNDTDIDGDTLTLSSVSIPTDKGSVSIVSGEVRFDPGSDFDHLTAGDTEDVVISYSVFDGITTDDGILTLTITGTNDGATLSGTNTGNATEDNPATATGSLTISDADDGENKVIAQTGSSDTYGTFTILENGNWTYSIDNSRAATQALANGDTDTDSFTVWSADGTDSRAITITVTGTNDAATISGDNTGTVTEDASTTQATGILTVEDADNGEAKVIVQTNISGTYGTFSIDEAGNWTYSLDNSRAATQALSEGQEVTDPFTVSSNDGSDDQIITITITGANEAPVAVADTANATENQIIAVDVLDNDTDIDNDTLSLTTVSVADGQGSVTIVNGEIRFDPGTDFDDLAIDATEDVTVSYTVSDGITSDDGTLTITITGLNDAPTVSGNITLGALENNDLIITEAELLANASDEENDTLSVINLTVAGTGTIVDNNNGTWTYTPAANTFGNATLNYDVSDGISNTAAAADVTIEEITFTIPYGDYAGTTLHFNDPLLPFQANLLGYYKDYGTRNIEESAHINIVPVWEEYSGAGIWIGSSENIDYLHPELSNTYREDHYNYNPRLEDPNATILPDYNYHGTATAGIISAGADNGIGLVGIAYGAQITTFLRNQESGSRFDIITNSTGVPNIDFFVNFSIFTSNALDATLNGRNNLGSISVNSAGNAGSGNDFSSEASSIISNFEIISVGAIDRDGFGGTTTFGSAIHIVAPLVDYAGGSPLTIDRSGDFGKISSLGSTTEYTTLDPTQAFSTYIDYGLDLADFDLDSGDYGFISGSSGAAPIVSASVALILEASTNNIFNSSGLGWRDVQEILAFSSSHTGSDFDATILNDPEHHNWTINGANNFNGGGLHFSPDYGFGMLDVHAAVRLAETWHLQHTSDNMVTHSLAVNSVETIEYGVVIEMSFDLSVYSDLDLDVVSFNLDITHDNWSEMLITIISPDNTESIIF